MMTKRLMNIARLRAQTFITQVMNDHLQRFYPEMSQGQEVNNAQTVQPPQGPPNYTTPGKLPGARPPNLPQR